MLINNEYLDSIKVEPILESLQLCKIEDSIYFSKEYSKYISNSRLSLINPEQDNDPKAFFEGIGKHNKYSDSLVFGSAVHCLVLQNELFHLCFDADRPTGKTGFMADKLYSVVIDNTVSKEFKRAAIYSASNEIDYYKDSLTDNKLKILLNKCSRYWNDRKNYESKKLKSTPIYLDQKNRERVQYCIASLNRNSEANKLLNPKGLINDPISKNEEAILIDFLVSMPNGNKVVLKFKAKLDNYTIDFDTNTICVNDLKTLGRAVDEFEYNFYNFRYYRELAIYNYLLSLCANKFYDITNPIIKSNCIVISTIPDYDVRIYNLTKHDFIKGWIEFKNLIKLVAVYHNNGYEFE